MMILRKALMPVALLLLCASYLPAANTVLVYGPTVFTVQSGPTAPETVSFDLPTLVYNPFTLLVSHQGVTGINVQLNGAPIFGSQAFGSGPLRAVVQLQVENTLQVELTGAAGGSVTVMITGDEYEHKAAFEALPLAPAEAVTNAVGANATVDWRSKGAVTPVKNQGQCGSDWAFSATGAVEGWVVVSGKSLLSLSEQQLIDCDHTAETQGCNGGHPWDAFEYIRTNGIGIEASYPYTGRDGACRYNPANSVAKISGFERLPSRDEATLRARVDRQPVSVVVDASGAFQAYKAGIFNGPCGNEPKHAVLIVGYGDEGGTPYWIVKNSWGTTGARVATSSWPAGKTFAGLRIWPVPRNNEGMLVSMIECFAPPR